MIWFFAHPSMTWKVPGTYKFFEEIFFRLNPTLWYDFLSKRLFSVSHISEVQKEMVVVLYALVNNIPIYVGKLIFSQIKLSINNSIIALFFHTIIT